MAEHRHEPVVNFDHNSQDHSDDPVSSYRELRGKCPVAWTEAHGGYWVMSGYDSVFEAARDDDVFSSARNSYGGEGLTVVIPKTPMHKPSRSRSTRRSSASTASSSTRSPRPRPSSG
jgi:cytochrome P450